MLNESSHPLVLPTSGLLPDFSNPVIDSGLGWLAERWEGYHKGRRCSRDTHPESYITKYTSIRRVHSKKRACNSNFHTWTVWVGKGGTSSPESVILRRAFPSHLAAPRGSWFHCLNIGQLRMICSSSRCDKHFNRLDRRLLKERIFIELMTSHRKLKASREGSK